MSLLFYFALATSVATGLPMYSEGHCFMKQIPLTQGQFALVDDEYYDFLMQWKWCAQKNHNTGIYYAQRGFRLSDERKTNPLMHRVLMNIIHDPKVLVDHVDGNGLNNQKHNLRLCNHSQNNCNRQSSKNSSSKYLGVSWLKRNKRWVAQIKDPNKKSQYIGSFKNEIDAAKAYNKKAEIIFGKFARLNIF